METIKKEMLDFVDKMTNREDVIRIRVMITERGGKEIDYREEKEDDDEFEEED